MANISGTNVAASVRPFDTNDTFPTAFANEIKGGFHTVGTMDELYAIPAQRRELGMHVGVTISGEEYRLISNPSDAATTADNWEQATNLSKIFVDTDKKKTLQEVVNSVVGNVNKYLVFVVCDANSAGPNSVELNVPFVGKITGMTASVPSASVITGLTLNLEKYNTTSNAWEKVEKISLTKDTTYCTGTVSIPNYTVAINDKLRINVVTPQADIKTITVTVAVSLS